MHTLDSSSGVDWKKDVNLNTEQANVLFITVIRDNSQQGTNHWGEILGRKLRGGLKGPSQHPHLSVFRHFQVEI